MLMRIQKILTVLAVSVSLITGCGLAVVDTTAATSTTQPTRTIAVATKPQSVPVTVPVTVPNSKTDTTTDTSTDTTTDTSTDTSTDASTDTSTDTTGTTPESKPEPTNPIDPDDIRSGYAYDTYTVRDWTWNASGADYYPEEKLVFLTFDDGPSWSVTPEVLDILKANDVHGTFFYYTNGDLTSRKETILRTFREGHAIAIHTDSHDYSQLYPKRKADTEEILKDVSRATAKIRAILNEPWTPTVYRFPGGSFSWTGSDSARQAMTKTKKALADKGLIYLDWNSMSGDSDTSNKDKSPQGLVNFTIQQTENAYGHVIVVLMHDAEHSKNTPGALQGIIDYFKSEGYEFGVLK